MDTPGSAAVATPDHEGKAQATPFDFKLWALSMGFASGFFGGLCGIRGPPIIMFFLHSPYPKAMQRANGAAILIDETSNVTVGACRWNKGTLDAGRWTGPPVRSEKLPF